ARENDRVHFVVLAPKPPELKSADDQSVFASLGAPSTLQVQGLEAVPNIANCGHVHVTLSLDTAGGDHATVSTGVLVPPRHKTKALRDYSLRNINVDLSLSRLASESEPVVTASIGFQGRARRISEFVGPAPEPIAE